MVEIHNDQVMDPGLECFLQNRAISCLDIAQQGHNLQVSRSLMLMRSSYGPSTLLLPMIKMQWLTFLRTGMASSPNIFLIPNTSLGQENFCCPSLGISCSRTLSLAPSSSFNRLKMPSRKGEKPSGQYLDLICDK
jgi:hypothetical protein